MSLDEDVPDQEDANAHEKPKEKEEVNNEKPKVENNSNIHVPKDKKLVITHVSCKNTYEKDAIVYYEITVKTKKNNWTVKKRYSDFETLNADLQKNYNEKLPVLPVKHYKWITDHTNPQFIEKRRALLDNYCKKLLKTKNVSYSQDVVNFFHLKNGDTMNNNDINEVNNNNDNNNAEKKEDEPNNNESLSSTSYEYPDDQEITGVRIDDIRKMSDHVLYTITVSNFHSRSSDADGKWTVLKRFTQFYEMDEKLRKFIEDEHPELITKLPPRPDRHYKFVYDHMDDDFIEKRRVLLENYLSKLLRFPEIARNKDFLTFLGVKFD